MSDVFTQAINAPAGRLAEVLINKVTSEHPDLSDELRGRFDRLISAPGMAGRLARVRLAADVSFLFDRAPKWTTSKLIPLFNWASPDAADMWTARKYSSHIGSPELFGIMKQPLLQMFSRTDAQAEDLEAFADWLAAVLIANQSGRVNYPLEPTEARLALRRAGVEALSSVAHRLAGEMGRAEPAQKLTHWRNVVGPVFQAVWPLDVELQTSATTFKLTHILRESGEAFPEAADIIIPFIHSDDPRAQSSVFSLAEAPEDLYKAAPSKMLDLIAAVVGDPAPGSIYALNKALSRLRAIDPSLTDTRKFQRLLTYASQHG